MRRSILATVVSSSIVGSAFCATTSGFPPAKPEEVGLSTAALEALDAAVRGCVERDEAVGAELMVIAKRRTVWHTAHGWADKQSQRRMEPGSIHCIRSMTKSVVGTAVQMLVDDGKLALDDRVARFIPEFDHGRHAEITVGQLLSHTSGLPLSSLLGEEPQRLSGVRFVAGLAAKADLEFDPGANFNYSDDGADTLAAVVEVVSGQPVEAFIKARICDPLAMADVWFVAPEDPATTGRFVSAYAGTTGSWTRFWSPGEPRIFGCFLGSQGMYATCADYAKLLCLWADDGMAGNTRLLSHEAIQRGLAPANAMAYPTGFRGTKVMYGQMWMLWLAAVAVTDAREGAPVAAPDSSRLVSFGHGGSDGTMAWMWPQRELIVLYFTQSRGGRTVLSLEKDIQRLLAGSAADATDVGEATGAAPTPPRSIVGTYWDESSQMPRVVFERAGRTVLDAPGRYVVDISPADAADRWQVELNPTITLRASHDAEGVINGVTVDRAGEPDFWRTLPVDPSLPSVDEIVDKVLAAHHAERLGEQGAIRRRGIIDMPKLKRHVKMTQLFSGLRMRVESSAEGAPAQLAVSDGERIWSKTGDQAASELDGAIAEHSLLEHPVRAFGDWRRYYQDVRVLARTTIDDAPAVMVRCVPRTCEAALMFVDERTGRVVRMDRVVTIPGMGPVGVSTRLDDFREIGGVVLPFRSSVKYSSPLLGTSETTIDEAEVVEQVDPTVFAPSMKAVDST